MKNKQYKDLNELIKASDMVNELNRIADEKKELIKELTEKEDKLKEDLKKYFEKYFNGETIYVYGDERSYYMYLRNTTSLDNKSLEAFLKEHGKTLSDFQSNKTSKVMSNQLNDKLNESIITEQSNIINTGRADKLTEVVEESLQLVKQAKTRRI